MVKFLIRSLHCNLINCNYNELTPLHLAARFGDLAILKYLVSLKCDPADIVSHGQPIHLAARYGHLNIIKYLIEEESCQPSVFDDEGITPLHLASGGGHLLVVRYLTLQCRCDPHPEFGTCLHRAGTY